MRNDAIAIYIRPGEAGCLIVRMPYSPERVEKIRSIPGREWDPENKQWNVPDATEMPRAGRKPVARSAQR